MQDGREKAERELRDGESLAHWINRNRPEGAPEIAGEPTFGPDGFAWRKDGWTFVVEIGAAGQPTAYWSAPDGHSVTGYMLQDEGTRTAAVDTVSGDPKHVEGWPVAA